MKLTEVAALLRPEPIALETGFERHDDGVLHVAVRTDMRSCTGEMFEWWFRSRPDTERYIWWHPRDHISSVWGGDLADGTHIGSEHFAVEELTGLPAQEVVVQFRPAEEFFDAAAFADARGRGAVSSAVVGRLGVGHPPARSAAGDVLGGRVLHVGRDTPWGLVMRSHFFLGTDLPDLGMSPDEVAAIAPDVLARALLQHAYNEFTFLARFLPSLYVGANRDHLEVDLPW